MKLSYKLKCQRFVAAGTVAEYAFCEDVMDLNEKQSPNDYYGAAKTAAHYFLDVAARQMEMPFNWVVIPSTYGEGRTGKNIITYTIESLLAGEPHFYGSLHQMWDFLYVEDVANALMLIGEFGVAEKTYGIGSGIYKPLKWYIEKIRDIIWPEAGLGIGELNATDIAKDIEVSADTVSKWTSVLTNTYIIYLLQPIPIIILQGLLKDLRFILWIRVWLVI